jgi:hypothetical protein
MLAGTAPAQFVGTYALPMLRRRCKIVQFVSSDDDALHPVGCPPRRPS